MVLADFLTETRRRWLKAFKLFKRSSHKPRNRVTPLVRSPSYAGTVDARSDIDLQRFCSCRASLPLRIAEYDTYSKNNSLQSYRSTDSAYDSARSNSSSPDQRPVCYATVTYFNVNDSEDSSSIKTEYTILDEDEHAQNMINEKLELVSSL